MASDASFLFASFDSTKPTTARRVHIRRLFDVLQLCMQRNDIPRARRAWAILFRCKEIEWKTMWTTGVLLLGNDVNDLESNPQRLEFLRDMMLHNPDQREFILTELVLRLILSGKQREALDELEFYLPSFPYQDNPVLHIYAGLVCLYLAQPTVALSNEEPTLDANANTFNASQLREAQAHLERARALDQDSIVANMFLQKVALLLQPPKGIQTLGHESDDEHNIMVDNEPQPRKRIRA